MSAPSEQITERFLRSLRKQFYPGRDSLFFQERNLLLQAITWPARWLDDRQVKLPAARYSEILTTVIRTIVRHGDTSKVRSFGRYLLHAIQEHMRLHGEEYYSVAKALRTVAEEVMHGIEHRQDEATRATAAKTDTTVPDLAAAHRILAAAKGGRPRKAAKPTLTQPQPDLFG